jgi:hypothetical protein
MRNATGYWITSLRNANVTFIDYSNGNLAIQVISKNGSIFLGTSPGMIVCTNINGREALIFRRPNPVWFWGLLLGAILILTVTLTIMWVVLKKRKDWHP